jgi:selenocysteine-specific elongation factor
MRTNLSEEEKRFYSLIREKGVEGLRIHGTRPAVRLTRQNVLDVCLKLEEDGLIKIISFSPLHVLAEESFDFLCEKILSFIAQFHENHPAERGIPWNKVKKRFDLPQKILHLALRHLVRSGKLKEKESRYALADFKTDLPPQEEEILRRLEELCFRGGFSSLSREDLREQFHLTPQKLQKMFDLLVERKKIIQAQEGFILHSRWLEEIIGMVKNLGKRELTVAEFKGMTGLSRKYAIPLLELLDQMGVTRRKGPAREIL